MMDAQTAADLLQFRELCAEIMNKDTVQACLVLLASISK